MAAGLSRPARTTRETACETEQQARIFADALNLAAVHDSVRELEKLLLEGLDSGEPIEATPEWIAETKERLISRARKRAGESKRRG